MKKLSIFLLLSIAIGITYGQTTKASPEEFKDIKARPLIVELLEIDDEFIQSRQKQLDKAKKAEAKAEIQADIDNHKNFVDGYNKAIQNLAQRFWDLNKSIEYKKRSEVDKLREGKSNQYTVLFFSESSTSVTNNGHTFRPGINLPTLNYSRLEKNGGKVDYSFYIPSTGNELSDADLIISLKIMKNHIATIEKSGESGYTTKDYGKDQAKSNCSKLPGKTLLLDKASLNEKATADEIIAANTNSKIQVASADEIRAAINANEDKVVALNIPYAIKATSGSALSVARVQYMKTLVNSATGEIYYVNGASTGEMYDGVWRTNQISKIGNCR
jgi:hypothetical protein